MTKFNTERTFGVEVEMAIRMSTAFDVAEKLTDNGYSCEVTGYHGYTSKRWKIESDSSCGYELVSPILRGWEGLNELESVLEIVNSFEEVKVNVKCGLHVHHGVKDLDGKQFKRIYGLYHKFEEVIDSMLPKSRRGNTNDYCKSIKYTNHNKLRQSAEFTIDRINKAKTISDIERLYHSRYLKLNCQKYREIGTIEFRQHSGTTDFEKIKNWVLLTQAIVESAKTKIRLPKSTNFKYRDSYRAFYIALKMANYLNPSEEYNGVREFYKARIEELAVPYTERRSA